MPRKASLEFRWWVYEQGLKKRRNDTLNGMFARLATTFILGAGIAFSCECRDLTVQDARNLADIVFRGWITGFRNIGNGTRSAVFAVDRVWKGDVPKILEMPEIKGGADCQGFPVTLEVGKALLVYAFRNGARGYRTTICSRTAIAARSKDFSELGTGHEPNSK
jgi:hypothetical protein